MALIKRCLYSEKGILPNHLIHERSLSLSAYTTTVTVYSCKGDRVHKPHLVRIDFGKELHTTNVKGFLIPQEDRKRIFPREQHVRCPIGKCRMSFRATLTRRLAGNDETVEIYECLGNARGHHTHKVRLTHGKLSGTDLDILVVTIEKSKD